MNGFTTTFLDERAVGMFQAYCGLSASPLASCRCYGVTMVSQNPSLEVGFLETIVGPIKKDYGDLLDLYMPGPRFELGTRRFSVACSTN